VLQTTDAIVLGSVKFGETSRVLHCYTRQFGLQGYLVNAVASKNAIVKVGMMLPLTQLTLVAGHRGKGTLERIKEATLLCTYQNIPIDPVRSALALFVAEVLHKTLREESANEEKFNYVQAVCNALDELEKIPAHFPSAFLVGLSRYLGFYPDDNNVVTGQYFDLMEGVFLPTQPLHPHYMVQDVSTALKRVMQGRMETYTLPKALRKQLLYDLLAYYRIHLAEFGRLKSVEVLEELFA
jgi:DNA repair protein RecO (recombination protein O)